MKRMLLSFLVVAFGWTFATAQILYENFEPQTFAWPILNGTTGQTVEAVANPDPTGINTSATVGKIVNNPASDFTFALGTTPTPPINLAVYSQLKIKVWSPVAGQQMLFKIEGGGKGVEQYGTIPVANQWVEMRFNLNCGSDYPALERILIAFNPFTTNAGETYYFDDIEGVLPGNEFENFESAPLPWVAYGNSTLTLNEPNPGANAVNSSATCAKFVRNPAEAWTLAITEFAQPLDLSSSNQFKMKVYASQPTEILFKLEGPGGSLEATRANIALTNTWQDYTFDLSGLATNTGITKIVIFFAPNTATDGTYYFDDIRAVPKSCACKDAVKNPDILDDFECQRNATYANGWDSLSVVANPYVNGDNPSKFVGKYVDPLGEQWAVLLTDNENPIDLSTKNQLHVKIWSPKVVPILFKLEGGSSAAKEVWQNVTTAGQWVEYVIDFSSQALASHKKFGMFFNAGQDPVAGDVYFIDDLFWGEKTNTTIEDFESGNAFLPWEPLDQNTILNGVFSIENNPSATGVNTSAKVGKYTKGTSAFSTVAAVAPGFIDISVKPQYNLDVWSPVGSKKVTMQLESVSQGNKEVTRNLKTPGEWETVNFDFTTYQTITDWASLRVIFDNGTAAPGVMYFFDNLTQGPATVDPCEGVVAIPNLLDDYECQRNVTYGGGADKLSVVTNPSIQNANQSAKSGKYQDPADDPYAALGLDFSTTGLNLDIFNQFEILIKAPAAGIPVVFKLEGGSSPGYESPIYTTTGTDWVKVTTDFSSQIGKDHKRLVIFFNFGQNGPSQDWYIDNLKWARAAYNGCIATFDAPSLAPTTWGFFENGTLTAAEGFEVAANPSVGGINPSAMVGKATEAGLDNGGSQPWGGMYTNLDAPLRFTNSTKKMRMKVFMPALVNVTMKLEAPLKPGIGGSGDNTVASTKIGTWEELEWDFSAQPDDADFTRVTLIWNIDAIPATNQTYYFDDIKMVGGTTDCQTVGLFTPPSVEPLEVSPNPVSDLLFVKNMDKIARLEIVNLLGQRVSTVTTNGDSSVDLNVSQLQTGVFTLVGYGAGGQVLANSKFVKQ